MTTSPTTNSTSTVAANSARLEEKASNFAGASKKPKMQAETVESPSIVANRVLDQSAETERKHNQAGPSQKIIATVIRLPNTDKKKGEADDLVGGLEGHAGAFARGAQNVKKQQKIESKGFYCIPLKTLLAIAGIALIILGIVGCVFGQIYGAAAIGAGIAFLMPIGRDLVRSYRYHQALEQQRTGKVTE